MVGVSSPSRGSHPFRLVVGASFTPESDLALDQAARIAARIPGCELHVVRAVGKSVDDARIQQIATRLEAYMNEVTAAIEPRVEHVAIHVRAGRASLAIASVASEVNADLIVLGARRRSRIGSLITGSVAKRVRALTSCPVMVTNRKPSSGPAVPAIEPPCADCLTVRANSADAVWWCRRHAEHHLHGHAYRYRRELPLRQHDGSITPTGVDVAEPFRT